LREVCAPKKPDVPSVPHICWITARPPPWRVKNLQPAAWLQATRRQQAGGFGSHLEMSQTMGEPFKVMRATQDDDVYWRATSAMLDPAHVD
jgi:hypothetical protein